MYPEDLFQLQGADVGSQWLNIIARQATDSQSALSATALIEIPENEVWLVNNICATTAAGAAQTTTGMSVFIRRGDVNLITLIRASNLTNLAEAFDRQFGGMPVRGKTSIGAFASFSAGVAANVVVLHVHALAIPRGNFVQT